MTALLARFRSAAPIPAEHRANFIHLYLDIAWFGVLSGSSISFLAVFATRQGADSFQIGLLNAAPAIIGLMFTLPAGMWLQKRPISRSVFWTSVFHRLFYLAWVFVPLFLSATGQVWALISIAFLMSIPGTVLSVGFNALFAAAVPAEWRGHVVGVRNALLSVLFIATSLISGYILDTLPFPFGYQVVFTIGAVGAAMSSVHLYFVRPHMEVPAKPSGRSLGDLARPGAFRTIGDAVRASVGLRFLARQGARPFLQSKVLTSPFRWVVLLLFVFHLAQHLALPLFPIYWVNELKFSDKTISLGTAVFYMTVLVGSVPLGRLTAKMGNKRLFAIGITGMAFYPALTAATQGVGLFLFTAAVGGLAWSLAGGAIANYILERVPEDDRPAYLAWYNLALNAAVLLGSLGGPLLAESFSITTALVIIAIGRFLVALSFWRWG